MWWHSGWNFCSSTGMSGLTAKDTKGLLLRRLLRLLLYFNGDLTVGHQWCTIKSPLIPLNPLIVTCPQSSYCQVWCHVSWHAAIECCAGSYVTKFSTRGCGALRTGTKLAIQFIPRYDHPNGSGTTLKLYQHLYLQAGSTGFLPLKLTLLNHAENPF